MPRRRGAQEVAFTYPQRYNPTNANPLSSQFEPEAALSDVVTDHANFNGRM